MRPLILFAAMAACACGPASQAGIPEYGYDVVHVYPHDRTAFTEGLFYLDGFLYEATGLEQHSSVRKVKLETGEVVQQHDLPPEFFGEGIRSEGLFYLDGFLYEATGLEQHSSVRKVKLETGEVVQQHDLPPEFFGEGIIK